MPLLALKPLLNARENNSMKTSNQVCRMFSVRSTNSKKGSKIGLTPGEKLKKST
jgi:hypothetical protein